VHTGRYGGGERILGCVPGRIDFTPIFLGSGVHHRLGAQSRTSFKDTVLNGLAELKELKEQLEELLQ
jgi:hypothetical protein